MKILDIALKDLTRSLRSAMGLVFMFVIPLLVTGMFYFMFGNIARQGDFDLPATKVVIANLDEGGPRLQAGSANLPGDIQADTLGELVVEVLRSEDLANLLMSRWRQTPQPPTPRWITGRQRLPSSFQSISRTSLPTCTARPPSNSTRTPTP